MSLMVEAIYVCVCVCVCVCACVCMCGRPVDDQTNVCLSITLCSRGWVSVDPVLYIYIYTYIFGAIES